MGEPLDAHGIALINRFKGRLKADSGFQTAFGNAEESKRKIIGL